eukprot:TRINITY_DN45413_c0_g1_i2.p1 TRINITY_DN45413_c0_g1~~TRINITY_DN45413_c0_g1_i2.p1  ORF type:complete len:266 (+),score=65.58 TRINITY_DN45413_c0_g1_i2:77-874(+)
MAATSLGRVFPRAGDAAEDEAKPPPIHELFTALMRDELSLPSFAQALQGLHGIRLSPAAVRLLSSVDATSGRLSFAQFQRALQEGPGTMAQPCSEGLGAGKANAFKDKASAIITDNSGAPVPGPTFAAPKVATDISADEFVRAKQRVTGQARGAFQANPVVPTNRVSAGNPLAGAMADRRPSFEATGAPAAEGGESAREVAQTATRMYVSGELNAAEYEAFLARCGIRPAQGSELKRLIASHEKVGDGQFLQLMRTLQRELDTAA